MRAIVGIRTSQRQATEISPLRPAKSEKLPVLHNQSLRKIIRKKWLIFAILVTATFAGYVTGTPAQNPDAGVPGPYRRSDRPR